MGLYWGWVVCAASFVLLTFGIGISLAFNEIQIPLNKEYNMPISIISWMGSLPIGLAMLATPLGTVINSKLGTRTTCMIGVLTMAFSLALLPVCRPFVLLFVVYGILGGLARMLIVFPPYFLLAEYFPYEHPRHVLATGVNICAFPLGTMVFNPLTFVMVTHLGWRITFFVWAASLLVCGVGAVMTFKPLGEDKKKGDYDAILPSKVSMAKRTKLILCTIWLIANTMKSTGYYTPYLTLVEQMDVFGISPDWASIVMTVIGVTELISRLVTSTVGDYFKGKIIHFYVLFALALSLLTFLGSLASTFTHFLIYGTALGIAEGPIMAAFYGSCSEVLDGDEVHVLFTLVAVGFGIGSMIGPTLTGGIFDATGSFQYAYYTNSGFYFVAAIMYGLIVALNKTRPKFVFPDRTESPSGEQITETSDFLLSKTVNRRKSLDRLSFNGDSDFS